MLHFHFNDIFFLRRIFTLGLALIALVQTTSASFIVDGIEYIDITEPHTGQHNILGVRGGEAPDSILTIPYKVTAPDGQTYTVSEIGQSAFLGRKDIKRVNLPKEGYLRICAQAFAGCRSLEEVDLSHVQSIYGRAFENCKSLRKVIWPKNLQFINDGVFQYCTSLRDIDLSGVKQLNNSALYECPLNDCIPPVELERIESYALSTTKGIKHVVYTGDDTALGTYALSHSMVESVILRGKKVLAIPRGIFWGCGKLKSVTIEGAGVKNIGDYAFVDCGGLLPFALDGITSIGASSFSGCKSWDTLNLPKTLTSIGEQAFYSTGITHVEFPNWIKETNIGANAFASGKLVSVKWPATWSDLQRHSLMFSTSSGTLEEVDLPGKCTSIPDELFYHCTRLRTVIGNKYITKIGKYAFLNCAALESFNHTSMIEEIGDGAFSGCKAIKKLDLHKVKSIPYGAFNGCESLETIYGDYGMGVITYVGERAFKRSGIIDIVFGDNAVIDNEAFMDCKRLTGLGIIYDLITHRETMDDYLFFPSTVKSIGVDAFRNCTSLKGIYIQGDADGSTPLVLKVNQKYNYRSPFAGCPIENVLLEREVTLDTSDSPWSPLNFICPETKFLRLANRSISMSQYTLPLSCLPVDSKGVLGLSKLEKLHICNKIDRLPSLVQSPQLREIVIRGDNYEPPTATAFHPDTYTFGKLDITDTGDEKAYRTTDPWSNFYKSPSSINETMDAVSDDDSQVEYYDIYGNRLDAPHHGMMIIRKNGKSSKVFVE